MIDFEDDDYAQCDCDDCKAYRGDEVEVEPVSMRGPVRIWDLMPAYAAKLEKLSGRKLGIKFD